MLLTKEVEIIQSKRTIKYYRNGILYDFGDLRKITQDTA